MLKLTKLIFWLLFLALLASPALVWFSLSETPMVNQQVELSADDIVRARQIVKTADPRGMQDGDIQTIVLSEHDLNLAIHYLSQQYLKSDSVIAIRQKQLILNATTTLPVAIKRHFLNIEVVFNENQQVPEIDSLIIGDIVVPELLLHTIAPTIIGYFAQTDEWKLGKNIIKSAYFQPGQLKVTYEMNHSDLNKMRQSLLTGDDTESLKYYYEQLVAHTASFPSGQKISLAEFLPGMFDAAAKRSTEDTAANENRALLMILGSYISGSGLSSLVPDHKNLGKAKTLRLRLETRKDFVQHYIISASIAAAGDSQLSNLIGLYKEIADSKKGSGFSFTDLAADRAGTRLGELLTDSSHARQLQLKIRKGILEKDIAPPMLDLPEHMSASTFEARYGKIGSSAYQQVDDEIERRIKRTPFLR